MVLNPSDPSDQELIADFQTWEDICVSKHGIAKLDIQKIVQAGETREHFAQRIKKMKELARTPHE